MLAVAALGMTAAGVTAYLVQRDRIMHEVDEHLLHSLESVRALVIGSGVSETGATEFPDTDSEVEPLPGPEFTDIETALATVLARVLPSGNESSLGVVDGRARFVSVAEVPFRLEDDPALIT